MLVTPGVGSRVSEICRGAWTDVFRQKVVFVNTDLLPASETRAFGSFLHNEIEGRLVSQITTALLACGVEEEQLAIVSVYRSQLRMIAQFLKTERKIEIATIDKYQGRDKDCVIISLVRNNAQGNVSPIFFYYHWLPL